MKKVLSNYLKLKTFVYILVPVLIIIIIFVTLGKGSSVVSTDISRIGTITEKINVTGKVAALKKVELGFEKGGVVETVDAVVGNFVKIGDKLISLDSSDTSAQLRGAQANLSVEKANLSNMLAGLRPEELSVEGSKLRSAQVAYDDSRVGVINALRDSYTKVEGALLNNIDTLFTNPQTVAPRINVRTESYNQENLVNSGRLVVGENLRAWKADLDSINTLTDPTIYLDKVHGYLDKTKILISQLSTIVSNISTGNSGLSQATIDTYNSTVNSGLSAFNVAISSLSSAEATYRNALSNLSITKDQFDLKKAGSSEQAIQAQQAKVDQATANVLAYQAELSKRVLSSPIDGIITKVQPEQGEFVSAGQVVVIVMSDVFKVEVNIPESDIAKIAVGNPASITLDAYDQSTIFGAHVSAIDPAETIVEGVPTYKVTLQFDQKDERVRSGMTANIDIVTNNKSDVVIVPYRAIINKNGEKYVRVQSGSGNDYTEVKVQLGIKGNDGMVEILSGLGSGVMVITSIQ
jgi:RND family efflux transporter MFP subunit